LPTIHPSWYKRNNPYDNVGTSVADSVGDAFQPRYIPQQASLAISQNYTSPTYRPPPTMDDQSFGTGLSPETKLKIEELKRLVYKYRQYQNIDPDEIVKWAINGALKGDTQFLDKKLEQLHMIEFSLKYRFG
jgi:hypothetical protein